MYGNWHTSFSHLQTAHAEHCTMTALCCRPKVKLFSGLTSTIYNKQGTSALAHLDQELCIASNAMTHIQQRAPKNFLCSRTLSFLFRIVYEWRRINLFSGLLVGDVLLHLHVETSFLTLIYPSKGYEGLHDLWHPPEVLCLNFIKPPP